MPQNRWEGEKAQYNSLLFQNKLKDLQEIKWHKTRKNIIQNQKNSEGIRTQKKQK